MGKGFTYRLWRGRADLRARHKPLSFQALPRGPWLRPYSTQGASKIATASSRALAWALAAAMAAASDHDRRPCRGARRRMPALLAPILLKHGRRELFCPLRPARVRLGTCAPKLIPRGPWLRPYCAQGASNSPSALWPWPWPRPWPPHRDHVRRPCRGSWCRWHALMSPSLPCAGPGAVWRPGWRAARLRAHLRGLWPRHNPISAAFPH
jgi:hypothetical protein